MASTSKMRIAVIDRGFVSPYFGEFFTILNQAADREYVVFHGDPPRWVGLQAAPEPYAFPAVRVDNIELFRTAIYQPLVREVTSGRYDAVILGHELKFLSNWIVAPLCKARRIPVILWGYGYHAPRGIGYRANASRMWSTFASNAKDWLARWADGYLAYTERGAERMLGLDLPCGIYVVRPSVNVHVQIELHEQLRSENQAALRRRLGLRPDSITFLYVGRLVEAKNVSRLIEVVAQLNATVTTTRAVEARIIGGGDCFEALRDQARPVDGVEVLGEIYDQAQLAPYFVASDALLLPGAAGITVTHAFSYGLPVIMARSPLHSPEADYVVDGYNGLIAADDRGLLETAGRFVNEPTTRRDLASGALATREKFSMEHMAHQFHHAVDEVLRARRQQGVNGRAYGTAWRVPRYAREQGHARPRNDDS